MPDAYMYLLLDAFTIIGPLSLSFDKKVAYYKDWKYLLPSLLYVSFFYLIWDIWFTEIQVWEFNFQYLLGPTLFNLPIEEYAFFFVMILLMNDVLINLFNLTTSLFSLHRCHVAVLLPHSWS